MAPIAQVVRKEGLDHPINFRIWFQNLQNNQILQPAERFSDVTGLCHHSVFGAKSAKNGQLRKVRFFVSDVESGARASKFARFPPKTGSTRLPCLSPLAFWVQKCAKPGPVSELLLRRVSRGPTARRGPGSMSDSRRGGPSARRACHH